MKYVRTKDGIYPNEYPYRIDKRECLYKITCEIPFSVIDYGKVIKQADTIEELCDEIVVVNNWGKHTTQYFCDKLARSTFVGNEKPCELNNTKVFGAIWTNKGLIYVAKMNDKGGLELL